LRWVANPAIATEPTESLREARHIGSGRWGVYDGA
jgi:hypothetical protein